MFDYNFYHFRANRLAIFLYKLSVIDKTKMAIQHDSYIWFNSNKVKKRKDDSVKTSLCYMLYRMGLNI